MRGIFIAVIFSVTFFVVVIFVHHVTHANPGTPATSSKQSGEKSPSPASISNMAPDCTSKEYYQLIATDASKKTVDFIVDKMITDKFIIVNKDGQSYRFKLVKKYKTSGKK